MSRSAMGLNSSGSAMLVSSRWWWTDVRCATLPANASTEGSQTIGAAGFGAATAAAMPPPLAARVLAACPGGSDAALDHQLLEFGDGLGRIEALGTRLRTIEDGVAAVEAERVLEIVETLARRLVAAVDHPAVSLQQNRRAQVAVLIPPVARAGGGAARAQDALVKASQLLAILLVLLPLLGRGRRGGLEPRLDRLQLRIEIGHVGHQVLDHLHVRQGIDLHRTRHLVDALEAGERVG